MKRVVIDFETRSRIDLKKRGAWVYSRDWSTVALCLSWAYEGPGVDPEETFLWHPAFPTIGLPEEGALELQTLFRVIEGEETIVEAHNAFFERCIWGNVMRPRLGWPAIRHEQWRCTAAKAASFSLPRKLEKACEVLRTPHQKDMSGNREMLRLSKPRKMTRRDPLSAWVYDRAAFERLFAYCRADVLAERDLSLWLRDLPPLELRAWQVDQKMNLRGIACDHALATKAIAIAKQCMEHANATVARETDGAVKSTSQVAAMGEWLRSIGVNALDLQKPTVERLLSDADLPGPARVVLEARRDASKSSTAKYQGMLDRMDVEDGRIRDILLYHGGHTGRWAGRGIQVQNLPSRGLIEFDPNILCEDLLAYDRETITTLYGNPMQALSAALRPSLVASPGMEFFSADYAAIEAAGTFWIAEDADALSVLDASNKGLGPKMYSVMAGEIFGIDPRRAVKGTLEYAVGKEAVLGLGYQMGWKKFRARCALAGVNIDVEMAKRVVGAYRDRFYRTVQFWSRTQEAAMIAIRRGDGAGAIPVGRTAWAVRGRFLHCRLPSGRLLSYYQPRVELKRKVIETDDGDVREFMAETITYMGVDQKTHAWVRQDTYGGKLTENLVQALCRDLLRDAILRLDEEHEAGREPYIPTMTIHDEIVSEAPQGEGDLGRYEALVAKTEPWAEGIPVKAEGWRGARFQ